LLYRLETGSSVIPQLARTLIDALFRALPDDAEPDGSAIPGHHLHQEILRWMQHYQSDVLPALDTDLQWRLLQARSGGAQLAGFWLLETEDSGFAAAMTPARWIALARHPMAAVRLHMLQHFQRLALRADRAGAMAGCFSYAVAGIPRSTDDLLGAATAPR
jgi:hypothetical protein